MIPRRVAVAYAVAACIISCILTFVVGTAYLDNRIEKGIQKSAVVDARVDQAFKGLCDILLISNEPFPKPPTSGASKPSPTSPFGKELAEYTRKVDERQAKALAAVKRAVERYRCAR